MKIYRSLIIVSILTIYHQSSSAEYRLRRMPYAQHTRVPQQVPLPFTKKFYPNPNMQALRMPTINRRPVSIPNYMHKKPFVQNSPMTQSLISNKQPIRSLVSNTYPTWITGAPTNIPKSIPKVPQQIFFPTEKPLILQAAATTTVKIPEYDYHIQTNQIPNLPAPIKQLDERGPIHTIPAPNLSLADKPSQIQDTKSNFNAQEVSKIKTHHSEDENMKSVLYQAEVAKMSNQYQVNEAPEQVYNNMNVFQDQKTIIEIPVDQQIQSQFVIPAVSNDQFTQMTTDDLYKYMNLDPEHYQIQVLQADTQQNIMAPVYQQQDLSYAEQTQQAFPTNTKKSTQPSTFQTFNYEEAPIKHSHHNVQFVQSYPYNQHQERHSVQSDGEDLTLVDNINLPENYYSSLPNKEAADAFLQLQEAAKTNIMHIPPKNNVIEKNRMNVYMPDAKTNENKFKMFDRKEDKSTDYDYQENMYEDNIQTNDALEENTSFGNRLRTKKN